MLVRALVGIQIHVLSINVRGWVVRGWISAWVGGACVDKCVGDAWELRGWYMGG